MTDLPWWMVCLGAAVAAYVAARRLTLAILSFVCIAAIGFVGQWDNAMDTLSQVIVGVVFAWRSRIPLGIWSAQNDRVQRVFKPILDGMQTLPQFVYLVPVIALFQSGAGAGDHRRADLRVAAVHPAHRPRDPAGAARPGRGGVAFGATDRQLLRKVQLPLAKPSIMLGVNQTIMMVLSVVIIAALVGGEGLGYQVINGLSHDFGTGLVAGLCILLLAIVIDRITQAMGMPAGRPTGQAHGDRMVLRPVPDAPRCRTGRWRRDPGRDPGWKGGRMRSRRRVLLGSALVVARAGHRGVQRRIEQLERRPPWGVGTVPDNSGTTINFSVSPWAGSAANVAVAQKLLEDKLGYTVKTTDIDEYAQFTALSNGDLDATLEVWPSGHAADYKKYIDSRQRRRRRGPARHHRADRVVRPDVHAAGPP